MNSKLARKAIGALVSASFMVSMIPAMATAAVSYTTDKLDFTFSSTIYAGEEAISYAGIDFAVSGGAGSQVSGSGNRYFGVDGNIGGEETGAGTGSYTFSITPNSFYEGYNIVGIEIDAYNFTGCQLVGTDWTYDEEGEILAWEGDAPSVSLELVALSDNDNHYFNFDSITVYVAAPVSEEIHRLYNPNSGEHFYTADDAEAENLRSLGWNDEGIGWIAPIVSDTPVYRLYNPNAGEHHYTTNPAERDMLVAAGWNYENIGWYSDDFETVPVYRQYNPNEFANNHNYTADIAERDNLINLGWRDEDTGWYAISRALEVS